MTTHRKILRMIANRAIFSMTTLSIETHRTETSSITKLSIATRRKIIQRAILSMSTHITILSLTALSIETLIKTTLSIETLRITTLSTATFKPIKKLSTAYFFSLLTQFTKFLLLC
jgi:hypothetical protein